jgi:hypothetical protein
MRIICERFDKVLLAHSHRATLEPVPGIFLTWC